MKKWSLVVSCLFIILFNSCEQPQSETKGRLVFVTGNDTSSASSMGASSMSIFSDNPDIKMTFTIEKIEISKDGSNWIEILSTAIEVNTEDWWTQLSSTSWTIEGGTTLNSGVELEDGEYTAIRIWFGSDIYAKSYDVYTTSYTEKTRTDFNTKLNPVTIYQPQSCQYIKDNYPNFDYNSADSPVYFPPPAIRIEKEKETKVYLLIDCIGIPRKVLADDSEWATFRDILDKHWTGGDPKIVGVLGPLNIGVINPT